MTREYYAVYPGANCTSSVLSTGILEQICKSYVKTGEREILEYSYQICNIATTLTGIWKGDNATNDAKNLCCRILALLVETPKHIASTISLQWSSSSIAPLGMLDYANEEANDLLNIALVKNPMLKNALRNGRLTFCAADWQAMSEKTRVVCSCQLSCLPAGVVNP